MTVTVTPDPFTLVHFDAAELRTLVGELAVQVGLPAELDVRLEVDETTPLGRARLVGTDPVVLQLQSGALEDPKRPRQLSPTGAADVLGRLLLEARDRRDPAFGDPPPDADLALPEAAAWQAYCVGRLHRLGHTGQRKRRLYQFRTRHGFSDAADLAFERLWNGTDLTWADIAARSAEARGATPATPV